MVNPAASSTAEVVAQLINRLGVLMTEDMATNLLNALVSATNNFQNANVTADAFELAATLMKAGGKRFTKPVVSEELPVLSGESVGHEPQKMENQQRSSAPVTPVSPPSMQMPATPPSTSTPPQPKKQVAPPDWLKPKIFKSTNIS